MSIVFKYIEASMDEIGYEMPELSICSGSPAIFSMLRPQFKEDMIYDDSDGVRIGGTNFFDLCVDTLRISKTKDVDLFLSPEYSYPYEVIQKIVSDDRKELRPSYGKLWCICCQGISVDMFKEYIEEFKKDAVVVEDALSVINYKSFVNALFYIFVDATQNLFLVPQIKTQAMSDPELVCEGEGLSQGSLMFKLGRGSANQLCTIICADVFRYNSGDITINDIKTPGENLILLHPQLNAHPRHDSFSNMRNSVYKTDHFKNMIYITSNWAAETTLKDSEGIKKTIEIMTPWSAIYIKEKDKQWFELEKERRANNDKKGLGFGYQEVNRLKVWYCYLDELMQIIDIKKPTTTVAATLVPKVEVQVKTLFIRNGLVWQVNSYYDKKDNLDTILDIDKKDMCYGYPINVNKEQRDKFFGISLGRSEKEQLLLDTNEIPTNVGTYIDSDCDKSRSKKLIKIKKLKTILKEKKLPFELNLLNENHKFDLLQDTFNVVSKDGNHDMVGMIMYTDNEIEAKKFLKNLKKN